MKSIKSPLVECRHCLIVINTPNQVFNLSPDVELNADEIEQLEYNQENFYDYSACSPVCVSNVKAGLDTTTLLDKVEENCKMVIDKHSKGSQE